MRTFWTQKEDDFLLENYRKIGGAACAISLGKSYGSIRNRVTKRNLKYCPYNRKFKDIPSQIWNGLIRGARDRGLAVEIDRRYIWDMYESQNRKCALTGWDITFDTKGDNTASVDRIDSSKGYVPGNVQIVHKLVNRAKVNSDELDFYAMCKAVTKHREKDFMRWEHIEEMDIENDTIRHSQKRVLGRSCIKQDYSEAAIFGKIDSISGVTL